MGLAAANLLGAAGIATLVIERNAGVSAIPKAIALNDEGLRICQTMGPSLAVSDSILSDLSVECVSEGRLLAKLAPQSRSNGHPHISTFYQPALEAVLLDGARRFPCVEVRLQHTVEALEQDAHGVNVIMRTPAGTLRQVRCAYLLACDGGRSTVRNLLNIPLRGMTFAQRWLVIDAICGESAQKRCVTIYCNPRRPAVAIPAPDQRRRWEFMLLPGETEKDMLEPATVSKLLQQYAAPQTQVVRHAVYTFHAAQAREFSRGRVFLLGDAAHMMPPFGGQGLNSGLRDAHNLAWKVAMVLQGRASSPLLETYHQERSRHTARMVALASVLGRLFMPTAPSLAYFRNLLIRLLNAVPLTRTHWLEMFIKPQVKYSTGFFVWEARPGKRQAGTLLPQPEVITRQGEHVLLDEVLGTGFAVLRRHPDPEEAFASLSTEFWERLGTRFVCIQGDDVALKRGTREVGAMVRRPARWIASIVRGTRMMARGTRAMAGIASTLPNYPRQPSHVEGRGDAGHRPDISPQQSLPCVVIRSMEPDFLSECRDRFVVVRPDRFVLGTFTQEGADEFIRTLEHLLFFTGKVT